MQIVGQAESGGIVLYRPMPHANHHNPVHISAHLAYKLSLSDLLQPSQILLDLAQMVSLLHVKSARDLLGHKVSNAKKF